MELLDTGAEVVAPQVEEKVASYKDRHSALVAKLQAQKPKEDKKPFDVNALKARLEQKRPAKATTEDSNVSVDEPKDDVTEAKDDVDTSDADLASLKHKQELRNARADVVEFKEAAEKYKADQERLAKVKTFENPNDVFEDIKERYGITFGQLVNELHARKDKLATAKQYANLPPEVQEAVKHFQQSKQTEADKAKETEFQTQVTKYSTTISTFIENNEEKYPFLATNKDLSAKKVAEQLIKANSKEAAKYLDHFEQFLEAEYMDSFSNEAALRKALEKNPGLKEKVLGFLNKSPTQSNKSPAAASQTSSKKSVRDTSNASPVSNTANSPKVDRKSELRNRLRQATGK